MPCAIVENFVRVNGIVFNSMTINGTGIQCAPFRGQVHIKKSYVVYSRSCFFDVWKIQYR